MLPTLLTKGAIVPQKWMTSSQLNEIKSSNSIDFLINYWKNDIPSRRGHSKKILESYGEKVFLIESGTGSGKSTVIPPYIFKHYFDGLNKNICVTQPRVFNSIDIATSVSRLYDFMILEDTVGYQTGPTSKKPTKGVIYMTIGVLLQQFKIMTDLDLMGRYFCIIVDECHVRDLNNDPVMQYIKKFLQRNYKNPDCPIVLYMSATFDVKEFMEYFDVPSKNYIKIEGRCFPIEERWVGETVDAVQKSVDLVRDIHMNIGRDDIKSNCFWRDIIIFVDGGARMKSIAYELYKLNNDAEFVEKGGGYIGVIMFNRQNFNKNDKDYMNLLAPIEKTYDNLIVEENKKIGGNSDSYDYICTIDGPFWVVKKVPEKTENYIKSQAVETKVIKKGGAVNWNSIKWGKTIKPVRRVIIGTNIAETGITIESLKYCIDTGFHITVEFNPLIMSDILMSRNITQSMALQRKGRVGRKAPGIWYPLYSQEMFNQFNVNQYPDIVTADITSSLLGIIINQTESELIFEQKTFGGEIIPIRQVGCNINFSNLDLMTYPSSDMITYALEKLLNLGFIEYQNKVANKTKTDHNAIISPTLLGILANNFRTLSLESIRMLLAGFQYEVNIFDMVTIVAMINIKYMDIHSVRINKYKSQNPLEKLPEEALNYYKILWGCDFIECLWIWYKYTNMLEEITKKNKFSISYIKKWCSENNLILDGLLKIADLRDEIIETLIQMGFIKKIFNNINLFNLIQQDTWVAVKEIQKIKKCILDGYRMKLCVLKNDSYELLYNSRKVNIESPIVTDHDIDSNSKPRYVIVSDIITSNLNGYFKTTGERTSIMDGFVEIDELIFN
jgi:HrpA-like RNA helicase